MKVIDSHIHRYPDEVIQDPAAWADTYNEPHWKSLVLGTHDKPSIQGWASRDKLILDMNAAGIDKVVMQGWYWQHQKTCRWHNDWHSKWIQEDPDRLIAFASVQPRDGLQALEDLKKAFDGGAKGIGEVFPAAQGFERDNKVWLQIVEFALENKLPITMHVTEPVGHKYPGKIESPLADYQWLAQEYPDLKLILAHWGGLLPFYELNSTCRKSLQNVYYDTAASPLLYDIKVYRAVTDLIGADKILFGSDYPLRVYPKRQKEPNFVDVINEVKKKANLSDQELTQILGQNIQNLLNL